MLIEQFTITHSDRLSRTHSQQYGKFNCDYCHNNYEKRCRKNFTKTLTYCSHTCSSRSRSKNFPSYTCKNSNCGKEFQIFNCVQLWRKKYCSRNCKITCTSNASTHAAIGECNVTCKICNTPFKGQKTAKFCPTCVPDKQFYSIAIRYNISKLQYEDFIKKQNNRCAICNRTPGDKGCSLLCVDHDHNTSKVRGLLCMNCNSILGILEMRPEFFEKAKIYLKG